MGFLDWLKLFSGHPWDVCVLAKGYFPLGGWKMDLAARCRFRDYLTVV